MTISKRRHLLEAFNQAEHTKLALIRAKNSMKNVSNGFGFSNELFVQLGMEKSKTISEINKALEKVSKYSSKLEYLLIKGE